MKACLYILLGVFAIYYTPSSLAGDSATFYNHGPVRLKILWNKPAYTECDGNLLNVYRGLSEYESQIRLHFLDYDDRFSSILSSSSIMELNGSLATEMREEFHLEEGKNTYLARLYFVHPAMLSERWLSLKYFESGCAELTQFAPGDGDAYFEGFVIINTSFNILRLESRGLWY